MNSNDTTGSTCSPESADGTPPSTSADGPQIDLFGRAVVPVPHSVKRAAASSVPNAKARVLCGMLDELAGRSAQIVGTTGRRTTGTYGRKPGDSSHSADLQRSLASRLAENLAGNGSPEYVLRLKSWAIPLGPPIFRLEASERRTRDSACSGWPTPDAMAGGGGYTDPKKIMDRAEKGHQKNLRDAVQLIVTDWPTPKAKEGGPSNLYSPKLQEVAGWATPLPRDHKDTGNLENVAVNAILGRQVLQLAPWPTPKATNNENRQSEGFSANLGGVLGTWGTPRSGSQAGENLARADRSRLEEQVHLAPWETPGTRHNSRSRSHRENRDALNPSEALEDTGSSCAETEKRGALNPEFSRWLMGFPPVWDVCAVMETPSSLR